jgi:hypothetical protein
MANPTGVATGHGIVTRCVGVLRRRFLDRCPYVNKLGIEPIHISAAVDMKCHMVEPWGISVMFPSLPSPSSGFECNGEPTLIGIFDGPTCSCRSISVQRRPLVSQQG